MDVVEYLSNADDRLEWGANGMPKDDVSTSGDFETLESFLAFVGECNSA